MARDAIATLARPAVRTIMTGLSARLLVLTIFFVMVAEVLIYVPSIANFRLAYLEERIAASHIATLALEAAPDYMISDELQARLLAQAEVLAVVLKRAESRRLVLGSAMPPEVDDVFDLSIGPTPDSRPFTLIADAFETLDAAPGRTIRVIGPTEYEEGTLVDVIMDETAMRAEMYAFSGRILALSIVISVISASLVYLSLHWLMVRPMRRITQSMVRFRDDPEDARVAMAPSLRADEIGTAERELAEMQTDLRAALKEKTRLAALGAAVSKINHDLRNILATAQLMSDRLVASDDPEVRRISSVVVRAVDRAIRLCSGTLRYGSAEEAAPERAPFELRDMVLEVGVSLGLTDQGRVAWRNAVDDGLSVTADREQLFRVLLNLGRNAVEAIEATEGRDGGTITVTASRGHGLAVIVVADDGPGLPEAARANLYQAFTGSTRSGGGGLGLSIARDLMRAHGGDIALVKSDAEGTTFRLDLPDG